MGFEEFKTDEILIAHVNEKITKTFMAKMGDNSGRVLKVQITNEGEIIDMTGYSVYLLWAHESGTHKGIEAFTAVDATQGVYSLEYPATMLNHAGVLHAYIQVVNPDNDIINTLNFRIYVQGDNGVMGDTEVSDLYATFKELMANFEEMMNASGVNIKGSYDSLEELQESVTNPETGDGYLVDGDLYLWLDGAWKNVGRIKGDSGTIEVGTVTSGTTASVTNVGTERAAILDFVLPKGDKGDKGDTGDTGAKGDTGETGATGAPGQAATIQVGTVTTGAAGSNVSVTNSGTANAAVLNFTIPRGDKGETGDGGVPADGEVGQVLKKTATGTEWADESGIETPVSIANGGTGASDAATAANNLGVYSLLKGEEIPANSDLDNYIKPGNYCSPDSNRTSTLENCPVSSYGFSLNVVDICGVNDSGNVAYGYQELKQSSGVTYVREFSNSTLGSWVKIPTQTDLANYLPLTGGELTGDVMLDNSTNLVEFRAARTVNDTKLFARTFVSSEGYATFSLTDSSVKTLNGLALKDNETMLVKPLTLSSGGTGQKTAKGAQHALLSNMNSASDTPTDDSDMVFAYDASTANDGAIFKRPLSTLWTWIKSKADDVYAKSSHTHEIANITDFPNLTLFEQIYQNSNVALSGTTSKVIYAYRMGTMFFAQCYIVTIQQTKPSDYGQKTTANLTLPFPARKGNMSNYPSLTMYNSMCLTNGGASESYLGTPDINTNGGTAITFNQYLGGGGTAQKQTWLVTLTGYLYND